jgi:hypothetical protein
MSLDHVDETTHEPRLLFTEPWDRHGPAAIGKIHRFDPANARWAAQFEVCANHRGEVRGVVRTPRCLDVLLEPGDIGRTADEPKQESVGGMA